MFSDCLNQWPYTMSKDDDTLLFSLLYFPFSSQGIFSWLLYLEALKFKGGTGILWVKFDWNVKQLNSCERVEIQLSVFTFLKYLWEKHLPKIQTDFGFGKLSKSNILIIWSPPFYYCAATECPCVTMFYYFKAIIFQNCCEIV